MFREVCAQPECPSAVLLTATPNVVIVDEGAFPAVLVF